MRTLVLFLVYISLTFSYAQDLNLELFASGLNSPVSMKHGGDDRLYVVEQNGFIKIINSNGSIESTLFLDIDDRVIDSGNERGLLGLAFHPNYAANGYFFVNYNNNSGDTVISRFTRNSTIPTTADPNSELQILTYTQPFSNHNGGDLAFGSDGYLYISSGDGGGGGDPQNNAQDLNNFLGKILRIDVNNSSPSNPYDIPSNNPFVGNPNALDEIWSYGLRNPWKFSFDRSTNDLWIGDVGEGSKEEINFTPSTDTGGLNYGWRCYEGNDTFNTSGCPSANSLTFPVSEYLHTAGRCSITGGYRYRGAMFPNFEGLYFFADYCTQEIGYLQDNNGSWDATFETFSGNWVAFGEDVNGELYVSSIGGDIFKLVDNTLDNTQFELERLSVYPNPAKHEINIDFSQYRGAISRISIYDISGKLLFSIDRNQKEIQSINSSNLAQGMYLLYLANNEGKSITHKLIIN
ncbi:MAG: T9SS type A sorting domain-containing protein [Winogradskyella sp.]|uniref:PQQ-dependent sugar dehydrogenase n=1 Tax=Winogradskyella sp. TaxID=1883156 RepID=UPI0017EBBBB2|nr:T9SS type A sorting domain-containing protein [Winogradskyella sp.]